MKGQYVSVQSNGSAQYTADPGQATDFVMTGPSNATTIRVAFDQSKLLTATSASDLGTTTAASRATEWALSGKDPMDDMVFYKNNDKGFKIGIE